MTSPKWIVRHVLVVALVVVMVAAGFWQLRRLDEKRAQADLLEARQDRPPADVADLVTEGAGAGAVAEVLYRSVTASGTYADEGTVVVPNRSFNGASGGWVLTPLVLADGTAVAVNRGFIGFDRQARIVPPRAPAGEVTVEGLVVPSEEGGRLIEADGSPGQVDELTRADVGRFDELVEADLLPVLVQRVTSEPDEPQAAASGAPQLAALDRPAADDGPHLAYAVQWFTFSVIAAGGYVLLLRRVALDQAKEQLDVPSPGDDLDRELEELLRSQG